MSVRSSPEEGNRNGHPSLQTGQDEEEIMPGPRMDEEETEEQRNSHPSLQQAEEEFIPGPRMDEEETEEQAAAESPLNGRIPRIPTENVQPLVVSFMDRASTVDLTQKESREALAEMLLEIISTICNLILDAFRNMLLERSEQEARLQVSEEAIRRAVCPSLFYSFRTALGHTHQSMNALFKVMSEIVTGHINSVLSCSRMKGERLVVPRESNYRPSKEKMRAMVGHARTMLRSFKSKVQQGCRGRTPTHGASPKRLRATLGRCVPCGGRSERQNSTDEAEFDEEQEHSMHSKPAVEKERASSKKWKLRDKLDRCRPCGGLRQEGSDGEESEESEEEQPRARPFRARLCSWMCTTCSASEIISPGSTGFRRSVLQKSTDPATEEVESILLNEAMALSGEEQGNLRRDSQETASSIISLISDEISRRGSPSIILCPCPPSLAGVSNKIKSFFTLCFTKAALRRLLRKLCRFPSCRSEVSVEDVMEEASPLLQELVQTERDVYQTLLNLISQRKLTDLSEQLTDVISTRMAPAQHRQKFRLDVQTAIRSLLVEMSHWIHRQMQLPGLKNPVQRVLERISRLVFRTSRSAPSTHQLTLMEGPVPLPSRPINQEVPLFLQPSQPPQVVPLEIPAEAPVPAPDVPRATPERPRLWSQKHCNVLVYEVVSRIFQNNVKMMIPLSKELMTQLCEKVSEWNVQVEPSVRSCEEVASAVYKELCKGQKKTHVMHAALVQSDFSSEVLDAIHRNLTAPPKKRRTLGSFLRSVCCAICRR